MQPIDLQIIYDRLNSEMEDRGKEKKMILMIKRKIK